MEISGAMLRGRRSRQDRHPAPVSWGLACARIGKRTSSLAMVVCRAAGGAGGGRSRRAVRCRNGSGSHGADRKRETATYGGKEIWKRGDRRVGLDGYSTHEEARGARREARGARREARGARREARGARREANYTDCPVHDAQDYHVLCHFTHGVKSLSGLGASGNWTLP